MNRRDFLLASTAAGLAITSTPTRAAATFSASGDRSNRPNILFIWTDQQNAASLDRAINPSMETPAMDALARDGITFERAYCNNPICVPSRTNWLTGRMSHESGVSFNTEKGNVKGVPLSRALRDSGYDCGYFGKWHIPHPAEDRAWHGFDSIDHCSGKSTDPDVVPASEAFLRRKRDRPFFLVASFINPHDICEWARVASGLQQGLPNGDLPPPPPPDLCPPLPANFEPPAGEPAVIRELHASAPATYPTSEWNEGAWRQYLWAYQRLIHRVDAQVGAILNVLRETGADDNTLIVFSSDHGDGAAAHRWNQKTLFYEECTRVPLIVRPPRGYPNRPAHRDNRNLVSLNLDFFPTVHDYAGLPVDPSNEGRSIRRLIEGDPDATGHAFIVAQNDLAPRYGQSGGVFGRMLRGDRYKYVRYSAGADAEQLFDLSIDPGEMNDLTLDPTATSILAANRAQLDDWMQRRDDPFRNIAFPPTDAMSRSARETETSRGDAPPTKLPSDHEQE